LTPGVDGFYAATPSEWEIKLDRLLRDACLRARIGTAARQTVGENYCVEANWPLLAAALRGEPAGSWPARSEAKSSPRRPVGDVTLPPVSAPLGDSGVWSARSLDQDAAL
jgi:hypothetical protein